METSADEEPELSESDLDSLAVAHIPHIAEEIVKDLLSLRDGVVLADSVVGAYAVVLTPTVFNLLVGMADLAERLEEYQARALDHRRGTISFDEFTSRNLPKRAY